ncbi:hypothetical protein Aduo_000262 [Ancylostoma duodenale]
MKDFMLAATVPEVKPYHGEPTESFKRFLKSFLMKYPRTQWDDARLIQLLESFLRKEALTIFETLPRCMKQGSFDELIEAMKERLDEEGNVACVKALTSLRTLTMKEGQTVSDFCYVLEKTASQAYPGETIEGVSLQMAEILYSQLSNWSGSYILAETIQTSPRNRVYEQVKDAALRLERNLQQVRKKQEHRRQEHGRDKMKKLVQEESPTSTDDECESRRKHVAPLQNRFTHRTMPRRDEPKRCFNCGELSHIARDCRSIPHEGKAQREVNSFSTALESWLCTVASEQPRDVNVFFVKKLLIPVRTMGMRTQAQVDTGSEISIAPLSLFKRAKETGVDIDAFVEIPNMTDVIVRDASGNKLKILDSIKLRVEVYGRIENIPMYVSKSLEDVIILGSNVLQCRGFKLTRGD